MIVMWKTERGGAKIERVECTRVTSASVWFMKRQFVIGGNEPPPVETKATKRGDRVAYHDTWEDAHMNLMEHASYRIDNSVLGGYGQTLVAHPSIVARLKTPNNKANLTIGAADDR